MITDLTNTFIYPKTPEESRKIQEKAFKLGWTWSADEKNVMYNFSERLSFTGDCKICHGSGSHPSYFKKENYREITMSDLFGSKESIPYKDLIPGRYYRVESNEEQYIILHGTAGHLLQELFYRYVVKHFSENSKYFPATTEEIVSYNIAKVEFENIITTKDLIPDDYYKIESNYKYYLATTEEVEFLKNNTKHSSFVVKVFKPHKSSINFKL